MTERLSPERRAEIERGDTPTPQFVRGHQLTDREADVRDLLAELKAVEAERDALRKKLTNALEKQVCFIHRKDPNDPTLCNGFHSCVAARYGIEELAKLGGETNG